jgi:hypothetical protein
VAPEVFDVELTIRVTFPDKPRKKTLLPCLVTSAPGDGDMMSLRNVGIDLQIHMAPKPKMMIAVRASNLKPGGGLSRMGY